jgi:hypothetical protein
MTAVFAVWNQQGFAVAADESVSITSRRDNGEEFTRWTTSADKIFQIPNTPILIGIAGSLTVNDLNINIYLRQWVGTIEGNNPSLLDYANSFVSFLLHTKIKDDFSVFTNRIDNLLELAADFKEEDETEFIEVFENYIEMQDSSCNKNVLSANFRENQSEVDIETDSNTDAFLRHKMESQIISECGSLNKFELNEIEANKIFKKLFHQHFNVSWKSNNEWHTRLKSIVFNSILNVLPNQVTSLMFIGYGKNDWEPHCTIIELADFDYSLPIVAVSECTNSSNSWFIPLAQVKHVIAFLNGIDLDVDIYLREELSKTNYLKFSDKLDEMQSNRRKPMLQKISLLSVEELKFVAESFVKIESTGSFLVEDLPSVGGSIKVIGLSK